MAPLIVSAAGQLFMWPYIIVKLRFTGEQAFLHYNNIFGIDLVGSWWKALLLPIGGLLVLVINYLLGLYCYNTDKVISRLIVLSAGLFQIFLVWAVYLLVEINL